MKGGELNMENNQTAQQPQPRHFTQAKAKVTKPAKKESKGLSWKVKVPAVTITVLLVIFGIAYGIDSFFDSYDLKFQTPIIIQTPVKIESREAKMVSPVIQEATPSATPAPAKESSFNLVEPAYAKEIATAGDIELIEAQPHSDILKKVYKLESSSGKNDGCKEKGLFNGFGYGQNNIYWNCFESFEIVVTKVNNWFADKLDKGYTVSEALCYYNLGKRLETCDYAQKAENI